MNNTKIIYEGKTYFLKKEIKNLECYGCAFQKRKDCTGIKSKYNIYCADSNIIFVQDILGDMLRDCLEEKI
jgi:hypothetical protein